MFIYVLLRLLLVVAGLLVAALLILVVVMAGDNINAPTHSGHGTLTAKYDHPAYTSFTLVGKVLVPLYHPERWELCLQIDDVEGTACADFNQSDWNQAAVGDRFEVEYVLGNWTHEVYVRQARRTD